MQTSFRFLLCSLTAACVFRIVAAGNNNNAANDDDDDRAVADEAYNTGDGDYIEYWTDYAIQPKRCVV
jgi:hypothetical protein